jgi:glutamate formiminotransferase
VLECVINVSEGRDPEVLTALVAACGASLLDWHADVDHHRSVFTLAGPGPRDAEVASRMLARAVARHVDLTRHRGEHPRLGALDVVPFVALGSTTAERAQAVEAAHSFARWWSSAHQVPCFMYDDADPDARDLPTIRRTAFKLARPDYGPSLTHHTLGATAVGARRPLIAVNCVLMSDDSTIANQIVRRTRESTGGLPGVRALAFHLDEDARMQVSMNLVDLDRTGLEEAVLHVRELARRAHTDVASVELVGLAPRRELDRCSADFLRWAQIPTDAAIEARIALGGWAAMQADGPGTHPGSSVGGGSGDDAPRS